MNISVNKKITTTINLTPEEIGDVRRTLKIIQQLDDEILEHTHDNYNFYNFFTAYYEEVSDFLFDLSDNLGELEGLLAKFLENHG